MRSLVYILLVFATGVGFSELNRHLKVLIVNRKIFYVLFVWVGLQVWILDLIIREIIYSL
jgi:hypothetical protein